MYVEHSTFSKSDFGTFYNLEFYRLDLKKYSLVYKLLYIVFSTIYIVEFYGNQKNHFGRNKGFVSIIKYELETGDTVFYS